MNIVYISKYANVLKYGGDSRQYSFSKEFTLLGHNVTLVIGNSSHLCDNLPQFKGDLLVENINNVQVIWVNLPKYKNATSVKRFITWIIFELKIIKNIKKICINKPDAVISSSLSLLSIISGLYIKHKYNCKFVLEIRDIWPQTLIDLKNVSKYNPIVQILSIIEKIGYKYSDLIVGTMPGINEHVTRILRKEHKCICIPQGINIDFYKNKQKEFNSELIECFSDKNVFTVTYAGTLGISYALDSIIKCAEIIYDKNPNIHFVFLGNGIMKNELVEKSKKLKNVTFIDSIPKNQVCSFLKNSSILIHSFKMKKVFEFGISPNKFIDYMYSGRPIIVMFSGKQSLINEANCGSYIPSEDYLALTESLLYYSSLDKCELDTIGQRGKDFVINKQNFKVLSSRYINAIFN